MKTLSVSDMIWYKPMMWNSSTVAEDLQSCTHRLLELTHGFLFSIMMIAEIQCISCWPAVYPMLILCLVYCNDMYNSQVTVLHTSDGWNSISSPQSDVFLYWYHQMVEWSTLHLSWCVYMCLASGIMLLTNAISCIGNWLVVTKVIPPYC